MIHFLQNIDAIILCMIRICRDDAFSSSTPEVNRISSVCCPFILVDTIPHNGIYDICVYIYIFIYIYTDTVCIYIYILYVYIYILYVYIYIQSQIYFVPVVSINPNNNPPTGGNPPLPKRSHMGMGQKVSKPSKLPWFICLLGNDRPWIMFTSGHEIMKHHMKTDSPNEHSPAVLWKRSFSSIVLPIKISLEKSAPKVAGSTLGRWWIRDPLSLGLGKARRLWWLQWFAMAW